MSISPQTVVFDAYGPLFDVHSLMAECERCFPGAGDRFCRLWRSKQLEYTWLRSLMGRYRDFDGVTRDAARIAAATLSLEATAQQLDSLLQAYRHLALFPDVMPALRELSGQRRAILSNGSPGMLSALVHNAGIGPLLEQVLSVDQVRVFKPHPAVYQLVCKVFGVRAEEVAFVSSNFWDIAGADAFGFRTYWVNRSASPAEELAAQPTATVRDLGALASALRVQHSG
jgi:2-haloacid dehalogenase